MIDLSIASISVSGFSSSTAGISESLLIVVGCCCCEAESFVGGCAGVVFLLWLDRSIPISKEASTREMKLVNSIPAFIWP